MTECLFCKNESLRAEYIELEETVLIPFCVAHYKNYDWHAIAELDMWLSGAKYELCLSPA